MYQSIYPSMNESIDPWIPLVRWGLLNYDDLIDMGKFHLSIIYTYIYIIIINDHGKWMNLPCMYVYIYYGISIPYQWLYIYISGERVWSPQCFCWLECAQCVYSWTRTLLGGLWNVHNFCDTCTTSVKRAQLLGNVHNISDTCTTSLKRAQHLWNVHI